MPKVVLILLLANSNLFAQSVSAGGINGTVTDEKNSPMAGVLVTAVRIAGTPKDPVTPYSQAVKSAADGSFLIQGLSPGTYTYCAQSSTDGYLDACRWGPPGLAVTVSSGQTVKAIVRMAKGSILKLRMLDPANLTGQKSNDGKNPPVLIGVWDGRGHFLPMHNTGKDSAGLDYQLTIPFNTPLTFQIISSVLKVADGLGALLPASNSSQTVFQHNTGDPHPKTFQFTLAGVNP